MAIPPISTDLTERFNRIKNKWRGISRDWKKYSDQIIPEDEDFKLEILDYLKDLLDYIEKNFENLSGEQLCEMMYGFYVDFYYGSHGDDHNYLDFDGIDVYEIIWKTVNWQDKKPSKEEFLSISKEFKNKLKNQTN